MANLIITIIAIALVAIAAMTAFYFSQGVYSDALASTRANLLINESKQVFTAANLYLVNSGLTSFSDFSINSLKPNYLSDNIPIVSLKSQSIGARTEVGCGPGLNNIRMFFQRSICNVNGKNVVVNYLAEDPASNSCYTLDRNFTNKPATEPIVAMCLKINSKKILPSGLTYAPNGLPYGTGNGFSSGAAANCNGINYMDNPGQTGYCYIGKNYGTDNSINYVYNGD